jgi:hypothetical protein
MISNEIIIEPKDYKEALTWLDAPIWKAAMDIEMKHFT